MESMDVIDLGREAIRVCLLVGGPILLIGLLAGLLVGALQSMTGIHDQTVAFVPKILLTVAVLAIALPWLSEQIQDYTRTMLERPRIQVDVDTHSQSWN